MREMTINNTDITEFGARLLSYTAGGTELSNTASLSRQADFPRLFRTEYGRRKLTVTIVFRPKFERGEVLTIFDKLNRLTDQKNKLDALLCGSVSELRLPDGYYYRSVLESAGDEIVDGESLEVTYQFTAVRHAELANPSGMQVYCQSTVKRTDCRIYIVVGSDWPSGDTFKFSCSGARSSVWIPNVNPRDGIEIDGINKFLYRSGHNVFGESDILTFPYLLPGNNTYTESNHPDVVCTYRTEYFPTFV